MQIHWNEVEQFPCTGPFPVDAFDWACRQDTGHTTTDNVFRMLALPATARFGGPPWFVTATRAEVAEVCDMSIRSLRPHLERLHNLSLAREADLGAGRSSWLFGDYAIQGDFRRVYRPPYAPVPYEVRLAIFARDGNRCQACPSTTDLTIDHVFPQILGGGNDPSNLRVLCRSCNSSKGAKV